MKNKMDAVVRVTQHLLNEITQVKDLAIGTLETPRGVNTPYIGSHMNSKLGNVKISPLTVVSTTI